MAPASKAKRPQSSHADQKSVTDTRKLRNRISQRAFRARQSGYIKELEEKLQRAAKPDVNITKLEEENQRLRIQLLNCHKKLESLIVSMKTVSASLSEATAIEPSNNQLPGDSNLSDESSSPGISPPDITIAGDMAGWELDNILQFHECSVPSQDPITLHQENLESHLLGSIFDESQTQTQIQTVAAAQCQPAPQELLFNYLQTVPLEKMMGIERYEKLTRSKQVISGDVCLPVTNSVLSDHISNWEMCLKQKWGATAPFLNGRMDCLITSAYFMTSAFICLSWSSMTSWHTYTKAHIPVTKITAWHIDPTIESYNNMSQAWRPTKIQILRKHPAVIDWIPWPSIRDKLITYHAANPLIDNVICAIGHSYVMEIDLSKLIANIPPTPGYVSVWDLIQAISPETSNKNTKASKDINLNTWNGLIGPRVSADESTQFQQNDESFGLRLPAPDTNTLFGSHSMALQAFKLLGMDKGASLFRLAPAFFETHPEMYDHRDNIMASGVHLKSPYSDTMISPRPLDVSVSTQYKQLSSWTVDLLVEGTLPVPRLHLDSD